jgi:hypothetical protein
LLNRLLATREDAVEIADIIKQSVEERDRTAWPSEAVVGSSIRVVASFESPRDTFAYSYT